MTGETDEQYYARTAPFTAGVVDGIEQSLDGIGDRWGPALSGDFDTVVRDYLQARAQQQQRPLTLQEQAVIDDLLRRSNILYQTALDESTR